MRDHHQHEASLEFEAGSCYGYTMNASTTRTMGKRREKQREEENPIYSRREMESQRSQGKG